MFAFSLTSIDVKPRQAKLVLSGDVTDEDDQACRSDQSNVVVDSCVEEEIDGSSNHRCQSVDVLGEDIWLCLGEDVTQDASADAGEHADKDGEDEVVSMARLDSDVNTYYGECT